MVFKPWLRVVTLTCGVLLAASRIRELSQRPQRDVQGAESGAIGLAQGIARSGDQALQGSCARGGTRDPGQILGADPDEHVL